MTNETGEAVTLDSLSDDRFFDITTTGHDGITATDCAVGGTIRATAPPPARSRPTSPETPTTAT